MNKRVTAKDMRRLLPISRERLEYEFREMCDAQFLDVDVFSEGPIDATVAFVGDGPGEEEVSTGRPWVGPAGRLLFDGVRRYGINRANVYVTNVVKRQISLSRQGNERHTVHIDEARKWLDLFNWEMEKLPNVKTIFVLGGTALEALTGYKGILDWRGSVLDWDLPNGRRGKLVITNNPAYAQRELQMEPIFLQDCHKLHLVLSGKFKPYPIEELINPSYREARAFLRDLLRTRSKPISLDVEHISGYTACWGLANDPHRAMCINLRTRLENRFTLSEEVDIMNDIQTLCESHKIVVQGGGHEIYWCWLKDRIKIKTWCDALLGHHLLYPRLPHNLGFMTAQYTTHPYYKDEFFEFEEGGDIDQFWRYNCKDAGITLFIASRILEELKARKLDTFFFEHVMRAQQHTAPATVHGVAVDMALKERIVTACQEDVDKLKKEVWRIAQELINDETYFPNPGSAPQMKELYFDYLGLKGHGTSTDKTNRYHMIEDVSTPPMAKELLSSVNLWSKEEKFNNTFAKARASTDNRSRSDYKQFGVSNAPGRLSSAKIIDGTGVNMQNQPVRARAMYVADPGCVFGYFDLKQAEAQVVGFRANIPKWKAQFEQARKDGSYDCHRALCADMFKMPYDKTPDKDWDEQNKPTKRYVSKRCRHGLNYRMERFRLSEVLELPYHEACRAFALYHGTTPEIRRWWEQEERAFRKNREMFNALGRPLKMIQRLDEEAMKALIAFYPQSTVGDKVVQVWYQSEEDDDWPDRMYARVAIDVHDNLVCMSTPKYVKTCLRVMKKYAEAPIMIKDAWGRGPEPLSIGADLKASYPCVPVDDKKKGLIFVEDKKGLHRWSHMKEVVL